MRNRAVGLVKGLMVGALFLTYQAPGCSMNLDEAMLQNLIGSLGGSDVKIEFELDVEGDSHLSDQPSNDDGDSGEA